ncbi:YqiJ family protein [Nostoc sp. CHAB 5834]|nr:YqiJ family protein [Nostoc sp. CHAB 5834]
MNDLLSPAFLPYSIALGFGVSLLVLEVLSLAIAGAGLSDALHIDVDFDIGAFNWLSVKEVPLSYLLLMLTLAFSLSGSAFQLASFEFFGQYLTNWVVGPVSVMSGVFFTVLIGRRLSGLLQVNTSAVSRTDLLSCSAVLLSPVARRGYPGEAKVVDRKGRTHYVQVVPAQGHPEFKFGQKVMLSELQEHQYVAVALAD